MEVDVRVTNTSISLNLRKACKIIYIKFAYFLL